MGNPTFFKDDAAVTAGEARVPLANFDNGCNPVASCSNGIGINIDGGALPDVGTGATKYDYSPGWNWTLQDQFENARTGQIGQLIGGNGTVPRDGNQIYTWDTEALLYTAAGAASSGGLEGTLPDSTIRDATNADNSGTSPGNREPVPGATITPVGNASVVSLAAGWVSVP